MAKSAGRNLYRRGSTYWARIQVAGRDVRRSLHTSDRAEAQRKLKTILNDAERIRFGEEGRHKYEDAAVAWAEAHFGGVKESSANRYRASLRQMHEHFAPLYLDQINARTIGRFVRTRRQETGASNATIRRDLSALSRLIANACALGWMEENPAKGFASHATTHHGGRSGGASRKRLSRRRHAAGQTRDRHMSDVQTCKHEWPAPKYENGRRVFPEACMRCGGLRPSKKDIEYAERHLRRPQDEGKD